MNNKAIILTLGIAGVLAWPQIEQMVHKAQPSLEQKIENSSDLFAASKKAEKKKLYTNLNDSNYKKEVLDYEGPCIVLFYDSNKTRAPPCIRMKEVIDALVKEYEGKIKFCLYDGPRVKKGIGDKKAKEEMKKEYGILIYPTTIMYSNGKIIDILTHGPTEKFFPKYLKFLKEEWIPSNITNPNGEYTWRFNNTRGPPKKVYVRK